MINVKNNDNKCFLWSYIRHLNLLEKNPQRITKKDKEMINKLNYEEIKFPVSKKNKTIFALNMSCYESGLTYPIYVSSQKFKDCIDLLLISKILTDLCAIKQTIMQTTIFVNVVYNVLVVKKF